VMEDRKPSVVLSITPSPYHPASGVRTRLLARKRTNVLVLLWD
jgi:hypothetical protein